jgi:hypothetical protein
MKLPYLFCALFVYVSLSGCSSNDLSREKAFALIKKDYPYPNPTGYYIFTADPPAAQKVLASGLEEKGYVIVERKQRWQDIGKPLIRFTEKSMPFFLPSAEQDKDSTVHRMRTGKEDIIAVTGIKLLAKGKKAIVEYTTQLGNLTPFSVLSDLHPNQIQMQKAYFSLYDDGWRIEKKPGTDFLVE